MGGVPVCLQKRQKRYQSPALIHPVNYCCQDGRTSHRYPLCWPTRCFWQSVAGSSIIQTLRGLYSRTPPPHHLLLSKLQKSSSNGEQALFRLARIRSQSTSRKYTRSHRRALWTALSQREAAAAGEGVEKSHFGLAIGSVFPILTKIGMDRICGQKLNFDKISAQKSHFDLANGSCSSDLDKIWQEHTTQTQEQAYGRIFDFSQNPRWQPWPALRQITKSVITWKVYKLETQFFSRPMFSWVRNAMKLLFAFYDLATTIKSKMAADFSIFFRKP